MELPSLLHAHQQIRLGDIQASVHKWTIAIEYYIRAIEYFKAIQNTLQDQSLISIIQAQIVQCEKTIHLNRLKDRSEQAVKIQQAGCLAKLTRIYSTSNRIMSRYNTLQIENPVILDRYHERTRIIAKKNKKHDAHKIEELQMSYEALKIHLKTAFDDIERLKQENDQLRIQRRSDSRLLTNSDEENPEIELETTL